jgi:hypothetical protein
MKSLALNLTLALVASMTLVTLSAPAATASEPQALLLNPNPTPSFYLPKFGFNSFNIAGYGERVTYVQWGGLAAQMGLENGDTILRLNGFPLQYHGSWNDALYQAMLNGGWVELTIRDVRTGWIATRQIFVGGGYGPVTPKYQVTSYGPVTSHIVVGPGHHHHPVGPITPKKIQQVVKLFKD